MTFKTKETKQQWASHPGIDVFGVGDIELKFDHASLDLASILQGYNLLPSTKKFQETITKMERVYLD